MAGIKATKKKAKAVRTRTSRLKKSSRKSQTRSGAFANGKQKQVPVTKRALNQAQKLGDERVAVEEELVRLRAELQEAPEATGDEVDLNVYEREKTLGLVATYERRLEEINGAMKAAKKGQYGICERCGNPIDPARLKIFPETRMCVKCKNETETLAKRRLA